jgi:hypothetical protein
LERLISKEHTQTQAGIDLLEGAKLVKTLHLPPPPLAEECAYFHIKANFYGFCNYQKVTNL